MKRFLMFVGVAVVAAAMYVAASPASQQSAGPSAKQFKALQKQVTTLNKSLKALKKDESQVKLAAIAAVDFLGGCFLDTNSNVTVLPVSQRGTSTNGYLFGADSGSATPTTALDKVTSGTPQAQLQEVNTQCLTASGLRHRLAHLSARLGH